MRANPTVVAATEELARRMAPHLRLIDCREIRAGQDPTEIALGCVRASSHAWAWVVDGEPVALFGVVPRSVLGGVGTAWLLTTDAIRHDLRTFWLGSRIMLAELLRLYPRIEGFVDARFTSSVTWLTRLGFQLEAPHDHHGVPFRYFSMERPWPTSA